jgi:hypothetical protein
LRKGKGFKEHIVYINTQLTKFKLDMIQKGKMYGDTSKMKTEKGEFLKASRENLEWFTKNYDNLKRKYDNQWVAIQKKEVVATSSTYDQIVKALDKENRKNAIVEFIDSKQLAMFF